MNPIEQAIQLAIEGGWRVSGAQFDSEWCKEWAMANTAEFLLDPKAWAAIGKVKKWGEPEYCTTVNEDGSVTEGTSVTEWDSYMRQFLDHIISGDSLEESISKVIGV